MGRQIKWNKEQKCYHRHSIGCDSRPKLSVTGMNEEITTGSSKLGMGERVYIRKPLSPNTSLKYPSLGKYPWIVGEGVIRTSQRGITPAIMVEKRGANQDFSTTKRKREELIKELKNG